MQVPKEQRSKLDDKAVSHVFNRYGDEKFGFRLWYPTKKKLVKSRDVVFQENLTLGDFDKANQSKGTSDDFIELVPIPPSLEQPKNEEEIDELPRDDSASDILVQELVEHEEQESDHFIKRIWYLRLGGLLESTIPLLNILLLNTY